ncbi:MAG: rRNA maturation RNase YbeY [Bacteroidetes bacterium]|nr:rRNA maturation RNase YbeY [Bacteroidota bacterium]MBU1113636.1 rRNA maturation RNase YbeY [Bacteroidota bacterium]MBU1796788.1 rRNA maturation RNase YbeY [Bacteroidota bacterium]
MKNLSVSTSKKIKVEKRSVHSLVTKLSNFLSVKLESLNINFVDAEYLLNINKDYLNHNYQTDIITFNYSGSNTLLDGEIFISVDEAINNALKYSVTLDSEIVRLVIHGILHLVGFDDESASEKRKMKKQENMLTEIFEKEYKNIVVEYDY